MSRQAGHFRPGVLGKVQWSIFRWLHRPQCESPCCEILGRRGVHFVHHFWPPAVAALAALLATPGLAQTSQVVDLATRPGQSVRMLLLMPPATAAGSVILLAGGHG